MQEKVGVTVDFTHLTSDLSLSEHLHNVSDTCVTFIFAHTVPQAPLQPPPALQDLIDFILDPRVDRVHPQWRDQFRSISNTV